MASPRPGLASVVAKAAAKKVAPKVEGSDETSEPEKPTEKFTWKPKGGGGAIVLPSATAAVPRGKTFRFLYQMNKLRNDFVGQVMYAMTAAGVPEPVQDRVFDLDDEEISELVTAWTGVVTGATPGES